MYRRLLPSALALLAVLALPACDETGPTETDAELIVGTWDATTANVRIENVPVGIPVANLAAADDEQAFSFEADGDFAFVFDPDDDRRLTISYEGTTYVDVALPDGPVEIEGTYALDEDDEEIHFSVTSGAADDFHLGYDVSSGSLELTFEDPETLALLLGLADADLAEVAEFVTGASIRYSKLL